MKYETKRQSRKLAVAIGPPSSIEVEYFQETLISVIVTSRTAARLLIETITLRFQSDAEASSVLVEEHCGWEIEKDEQREQRVKVSPTPIYLENTNKFDVLVQYRVLGPGRGKLISERHEGFSYLILRKPRTSLGKIFISFKQPEDLALARKLTSLAERTGFETYRAVREPAPGVDLWERITPEIERSEVLVVIWSKHTLWGEGVQREMTIAQRAKVPIVLLKEEGMEPPEGFEGKVEYMTFDPHDPAPGFAECLQARRRVKLGSG